MLTLHKDARRILRTFDWGPRQVIQRCWSLLGYQFLDDRAFLPNRVLFNITYKCNLKCRTCWWWGEAGIHPRAHELSLEEIKLVVDKLKSFRPSISFTGGEVLTRQDMPQILEYVKEQGMKTEIFTNGTLITPELASRLVACVDRFMISVEGSPKMHDAIRGPGTFERTSRGIQLIKEAARASRRDVSVRINCVISSLSLPFLEEAVETARSLQCHLTFEHLMFSTDRAADAHREALRNRLGVEADDTIAGFLTGFNRLDVDDLTDKLAVVGEHAARLRIPFAVTPFLSQDGQIRSWYTDASPMPGLRCTFPWVFLFLRPDGEVTPCEFIRYRFGHALHEDLREIWNGPAIRFFRSGLRKALLPVCARCCLLMPWPSLTRGADNPSPASCHSPS
ncbi:MAG: radical SAM protein [Chloroflexi bacterium]|nr:radical SAM protein [Chloroflexota bacterium]